MKGQAVARILFVIALIVTAHAIRPFSMKNLTSQILYSTRSLSVVLPDSTRSSFDYANTLAIALSQSLFVDPAATETIANYQSGFVAAANSQPASTPLEPQEAVIVKPEPKAVRAISPAPKRVKPVSKLVWTEMIANNDANEVSDDVKTDETEKDEETTADSSPADDLAEVEQSEPEPVRAFTALAPVELPTGQLNLNCALNKVRPLQIALPRIEILRADLKLVTFTSQIKAADCNQRPNKQIRLVAVIEANRKPKAIKPNNPILECEDEGTEVEAVDAEAAGPQDEAAEAEELKTNLAPLAPPPSESCVVLP